MSANFTKKRILNRAHIRVRKKISGDSSKPRLSAHKSGKHIYVQIIDDETGNVLAAASSLDKTIKKETKHGANCGAAELVGKLIADKAIKKNIKQVVFDRGGHLYHGRIKSLAESARQGGLEF
ncbi:MAG: 50S ribosomal protein L18 [Candidatus Caenarcaniphilales bacterium]|nr:50S ribosomal protein L18 [Candidatus Caenarcaniphilales bacterium]